MKTFLCSLFRREETPLHNLEYIFCSDEHLLEMNREYLQHDYYTDIITFDLSSPNDDGISGEIYISTDRVKDNAGKFDVSFNNELHRVIFHGALHLCGYGDKTETEKVLMRKKEDEYLKLYFG